MPKREKMKEWAGGSRWNVPGSDRPYEALNWKKSFILPPSTQGRHRSSPSVFPTSGQSPFYTWHTT